MKKAILSLALILPILFISCSDDDDGIIIESQAYTLAEIGDSGVSGMATFTKMDDATTRIDVVLQGTADGDDHPMHIHVGLPADNGAIALTLENITGSTGASTTAVTALDDDTAITYEELIDYAGYLNVHLSATELATIVAQGGIGSNAP